jgi:hypothetical protein
MNNLKIRASQVGSIMTDPKTKTKGQQYRETLESIEKKRDRLNGLSDKAQKTRDKLTEEIGDLEIKLKELEPLKDQIELSETTKSALVSIFWEREFNIKKEIVNKYLTKGTEAENDSIDLAVEVLQMDEFAGMKGEDIKNEIHFENDFLTGTPDIIRAKSIVDIKTSFTAHSFPLKDEKLPDASYYWQIMSYLALTGREFGVVSYCLVDTPENLVQDELFRYARNNGLIECPSDVELEIREAHLYSRLPKKLRVRSFYIERDDEAIERIYRRVEECREYYNSELLTQIF